MQTQRIDLQIHFIRGAFMLSLLIAFSYFTHTAHAQGLSPVQNDAYRVNTILNGATEALVIMQESVDTVYQKEKSYTESTDIPKKKEYTEPQKREAVSDANIELLMKQIKQLQELIMLLMQMQQVSLGYTPKEKQVIKPIVIPSKEAVDVLKYAGKKNLADDEMEELQDAWSFVESSAEILVVGAYQGTLPDGQTRKFQDDREGEITVYVANGSGESLLVLSAYEPTHWKLEGEGLKNIKSILVTGYHDQRISGEPDGVAVIERIRENGDSPYFILYNGKGIEDDEYPALKEYLKKSTGYAPYLFFGEYEADSILVSLKG